MTILLTEREIRQELMRLCWCARRYFWSSAVEEAAELSPLPVAEFEAAFRELGAAMQADDKPGIEKALDVLRGVRKTTTSSPRRLPPASEVTEGGTPR